MLKILKCQKNRIYLESKREFSIPTALIDEYNLKKRDEISLVEYEELIGKLILSASYYYLARRDYARKELGDKLVERYGEKQIVEEILCFLEEKGYLDDYEFAKNYVKYSRDGVKKIEFNLKQKGIDPCTIGELLREKDQYEVVLNAWEKLGDRDVGKKVASLMRKGFRYEDIKRVMESAK